MRSLSEIREAFCNLSRDAFSDVDTPGEVATFASRYVDADSLVAHWDEKGIVSQIVVIRFEYRGSIPAAYLCYGATRGDMRGRGHYGGIMEAAFEKLRAEEAGLAFIIPASESLKRYYIDRFGFGDNCISSLPEKPLSKALESRFRSESYHIDIFFHNNC